MMRNDIISQCVLCSNMNFDKNEHKMLCKAFPSGMPEALRYNKHDHKKPYPGDNGIQFVPIEEEGK